MGNDTEDLIAQLDEMSGVARKEEESVAEFLQGEEAQLADPEGDDAEEFSTEEGLNEEDGDEDGEEKVEADAEEGSEEADEETEDEAVNISDIESLRKQYSELQSQYEQLLRSPGQPQPAQSQPGDPGLQTQPSMNEQVEEYRPLDFLENDDDYESAFSDREAMNRLLSRVYYTAEQNFLQKASLMADQQMTMMFRANMVRENFLKDNPEFEAAGEMLGLMVNKVANEKPDISLEEVLDEAASRLRKSGVVKQTKKPGRIQGQRPKGKNRPAFAKGTSSRPSRKGDSRSTIQRELDSME